MKRIQILRPLAFLLCLLLIAVSFAGCGNEGTGTPPKKTKEQVTEKKPDSETESNTDTETETETKEEETTAKVILKPDDPGDDTVFSLDLIQDKKIKIVYHQGAGSDIITAAKGLQTTIETIFGVKLDVTSDYLREGSTTYCEYEYEILVGETDREVDEELSNMRLNDYCYRTCGKKIVLIGGNDSASVQAVTDFTYDIVTMKKGKNIIFYRSNWDKTTEKTYTVQSLTLNGVDIASYTVVYPKNGTHAEEQIAKHLVYRLESLSGYTIGITDDSTDYADGYEISVGMTNRIAVIPETYPAGIGIVSGGGKIVNLTGSDTLGIQTAVDGFLSDCEKNADGKRNAVITIGDSAKIQPSSEIKTMSFNLKVGERSTERDKRVVKTILNYLPDVLGVQEANMSWVNYLATYIGDYYTMVGESREGTGGERTAIYVAKSRITIEETKTYWLTDTPTVESKYTGADYYRIYTYAKLKDSVTGNEWLHINTHLDTSSETVRTYETGKIFDFLHNGWEDLPVVITGDFNAWDGTSTINMFKNGGLTSTSDLYSAKNDDPNIDWIFVTADCVNVSYYRVCNERVDGDYPSDHYPVIATLSFTTPEGGIKHYFGEILPTAPANNLQPSRDTDGENFGKIHIIK